MHFSDIEKAYKNDQYPDAECMLTYPEEVTDNRPFTPAGITLKPLTVTRNGSYNPADFDADGFSWVNAEIEMPPAPVLDSIRITENGTYTPPAGVDGYNEITTDIHPTETLEETLDERKTYNFIGEFNNAEITVDIPYTDIHIASGPVATFDGEDLPLKELKASITPLQAGSGVPSSENIRPFIPWSGVVVTKQGKNWFDISKIYESFISENQIVCSGGSYYRDFYTNSTGASATVPSNYLDKLPFLKAGSYTFTWTVVSGTDGISVYSVDDEGNVTKLHSSTSLLSGATITLENDTRITIRRNANATVTFSNFMIRNASASDSYEPYIGTTYTIPFTDGQGQIVEVVGGEIDVISGSVTPYPYYESYNGEQLTGEWLSDRDVYAPNTTPSIGAQVVNIGANGTPFNVHPTPIRSLEGANNFYANTGDVYVEYQTEWTQPVSSDITLDYAQISSISNKYMGAISTNSPIVPGFYAISHCNSDQITGGTNLALIQIESLPTTLTLGGLSNFRLNVTSNSVEVNNYDGSAKDVYMSIMQIPDNAICVKTD